MSPRSVRLYRTLMHHLVLLALLNLAAALPSQAQSPPPAPHLSLGFAPIGFEQRFEADIEDGGDLEQRRAYGGLQLQIQPDARWKFALNTAYTYHQFRFSGSTGFGQLDPWDDVHLFSFNAPIRFQASTHWHFTMTPFLQLNMESDADAGQSLTAGGLLSVVYRFGDRLSLGLGIGGESRLEDDGALFLFPIVEWHITDAVRLLSNLREPFPIYTLELQVDLSPTWIASIGLDAREDRFRLDDRGTASKGIGEVNQGTLRASLTYRFRQSLLFTVYGGVGVGYVRLEDANGAEIRENDIDPAPVFGLTVTTVF